jgi:hypothetical protein
LKKTMKRSEMGIVKKARKVARHKYIGFRQEALNRIAEQQKITGRNETETIPDLILGITRFGPLAEGFAAQEMKDTGRSRQEVLEGFVLDALRASLASPEKPRAKPPGKADLIVQEIKARARRRRTK